MVSLPSCHQEAVFMGNGEEYIWKPPEEDDLSMFQAKPPCPLKPGNAEGGGPQMHSVAVGVSAGGVCTVCEAVVVTSMTLTGVTLISI